MRTLVAKGHINFKLKLVLSAVTFTFNYTVNVLIENWVIWIILF